MRSATAARRWSVPDGIRAHAARILASIAESTTCVGTKRGDHLAGPVPKPLTVVEAEAFDEDRRAHLDRDEPAALLKGLPSSRGASVPGA
jgi:hypothetical protein